MKKVFLIMLLSIGILPLSSFALEYEANERVYIDKPIADDFYTAGQEVRIRGDINGDLFIGGEQIIVGGNVEGDIMGGGRSIRIEGEAKDDLRIAGETIQLESKVQDDAILAGQTITIEDTASIGGDLVFAGGRIQLDGPIIGKVRGTGENIYLNSQIDGNVFIYNSGKITFGPKAKILGNLTYSSFDEVKIPEGVVAGKVIFKEEIRHDAQVGAAGLLAGFSAYSLLATLFVGLFLIGFVKQFGLVNTHKTMDSPFKSLGIGFIVLIVAPFAAMILMATVIGIPLGLILMAVWGISLYIAKVMAAFLVGRCLIKVDDKSSFLKLFGTFTLGTLIFIALGFVPYFGWALKFVLILMGLGGLYLGQVDRFKELRKKKLI